MRNVIAAEWAKVRSVRSTHYFLATIVFAIFGTAAVAFLIRESYLNESASGRMSFGHDDPSTLGLNIVRFCLAALAAMAITTEFGTGLIRPSLAATPNRRTFFLAKATVVAGVTLALGVLYSVISGYIGYSILGQLSIVPSSSLGRGLSVALCAAAVIVVASLVALGLGAAIRSTAGTLMALCGLLFIAPIALNLLPAPWGQRAGSFTLSELVDQLAGTQPHAFLSPAAATTVLVGYVVAAGAVGLAALKRRDV